MQIRNLSYPIAILNENGISGGKHGGGGSPRGWNNCIDSFFLGGGMDEVFIFDSKGRKFVVEKICLLNLNLMDKLASLLMLNYGTDSARVDIELKLVDTLTFNQFRDELLEKVLDNPNWWEGRYYKKNVLKKFEVTTFSELIDNLEVLEAVPLGGSRGDSRKIIDKRTR